MTKDRLEKLIFVYNANSGMGDMLLDGAHKILSPATYNCRLCELTYGAFTEKQIWKSFRKSTDVRMDFLHKDEFLTQFENRLGVEPSFPAVFADRKGSLEVFISTEEMNALQDAEELITLVREKLK